MLMFSLVFKKLILFNLKKITFYYNIFSISTKDNIKDMGRFRNTLLIDGIWKSKYAIEGTTISSSSSTECTLLNLDSTEVN